MANVPVTYVGTSDDLTAEITVGEGRNSLSFEKGKVVQVDDKHPEFAKLSTNPTFEVGKEAAGAAREAKADLKAAEAEQAK